MKKAPEKIWLQINEEDGEENHEVTWCQDKINDTDVEYVRVRSKLHSKSTEAA